ncbi:MAG TPA: SPFH domain-containing protein [Anaerolineae bacterium]|nr:SPFH domain-containing protein [Anaerolineae bacterium]HQI87190.1 SPFH domain-containing protein [Anaerolineae bacterium]
MQNLRPKARSVSSIIIVVVVVIGAILLLSFGSQFFYFFKKVDAQEIGIQFTSGRIKDVVGPGVYSDFGLYVSMVKVSSQAIPFSVEDAEIITKDKQRMGVVVSGDIFRPGEMEKDVLRENWSKYRGLYTDDAALVAKVQDFARQAMKVCIGGNTFDNNTIGSARDELRACIDDELNGLAKSVGLIVRNVVVPNIILSAEVQAGLDAIVQSRLETEKAAQDELRAIAQADAEQARVEGEIQVEQSRIQETTRQQTALAELERQRVAAQLAVIEAQRANTLAELETERQRIEATKANEILAAQRNLEIRKLEADAMEAAARGEVALRKALAQLYADHPEFQMVTIAELNASALSATDKIIFTVEGSAPTIVLPGPGITPTVNVNQPQ